MQHHRSGAAFDRAEQLRLPAQGKQSLGGDEHRADQQARQVVEEVGLAAFVVVADELEQPAQTQKTKSDRKSVV